MNHEERVIKAWQHIEQLNPYIIKTDKLIPLRRKDSLPWKLNATNGICYKIYIGVFLLSEFYSIICKKFQLTTEEEKKFAIEEELKSGNEQSCFATILVDSNGRYIKNSLQTSVMPLAAGKIDSSDEILPKTYSESVDLELSNNIKYFNSFDSIIAFGNYLSKVTEFFPQKLDFVYYEKILVNDDTKYKETVKDSTPGILNSFYLDDIGEVLDAAKNNNIGKALSKYLSGEAVKRINVEKEEELKKILTSGSIPYARWPKDAKHSLSLMQSVAVNKALDMKEDVFSVNGPPGTGKTTLLKDIIANIVYKRAEILAEYENANDIFESIDRISINNYSFNINKIDDRLKRYSIVIASSNNGAVENITKELPLYDNISNEFVSDDEYFTKVSDEVLDEKTWGLLSAALGNNTNKSSFFDALWFNKDPDAIKMQYYLNKESDLSWKEAVSRFKEKRLAVETEISRIKTIEEILKNQKKLQNILETKEKEYNELNEIYNKINEQKKDLLRRYNQLTREKEQLIKDKIQLLENKPNGIFSFFNKKYRRQKRETKNKINDLIIEDQRTRELMSETNSKLKSQQKLKTNAEAIVKEYREEIAKNSQKIKEMQKDAGNNFEGDSYWKQSYTQLQMSSPWLYEKINRLRSELFIESLRLHKVMVIKNRGIFRKDIIPGIINLLNNSLELEDSEAYGDIIWNNFFLLVPVISSTFASFENMAKHMKRESIGWLLIDEAGQAPPQAAVGAIWRSRNVIAVGDPLQIQPVVSTPDFLFSRVRNYYDLDRLYLSKSSSVQLIMDKANRFGGKINNQWVGSPLKVHRRCVSPMFDISNSIAYENKMVCATIPPQQSDVVLGSSYWFDVKGDTTSKHFVKAQGEIVKAILESKYEKDKDPEVYIISPFKDVVNKLKSHLRNFSFSNQWINNSIGTIHTFQGKEEKAVILCLGLDKNKVGAAQWASMTPNILNVAVSRAKYELIVIGDIEIWGTKNNFDVAKNQLMILDESQISDYLNGKSF